MHNIGDEPLVSGLIIPKSLTPEEIMTALLSGRKVKLVNAPSGVNFYLKNGEIKSDKITYLRGIPQLWFNKDIEFEIDKGKL